jgi:hypothetical protein
MVHMVRMLSARVVGIAWALSTERGRTSMGGSGVLSGGCFRSESRRSAVWRCWCFYCAWYGVAWCFLGVLLHCIASGGRRLHPTVFLASL